MQPGYSPYIVNYQRVATSDISDITWTIKGAVKFYSDLVEQLLNKEDCFAYWSDLKLSRAYLSKKKKMTLEDAYLHVIFEAQRSLCLARECSCFSLLLVVRGVGCLQEKRWLCWWQAGLYAGSKMWKTCSKNLVMVINI